VIISLKKINYHKALGREKRYDSKGALWAENCPGKLKFFSGKVFFGKKLKIHWSPIIAIILEPNPDKIYCNNIGTKP
jgi:hypothetical protein